MRTHETSTDPQSRTGEQSLPAGVKHQSRYCIVGGGPSGMVTARAFIAEGIPFDWYERNGDFGGIWDIEAEGSPMYESAHFISSKHTSSFYGYPMPDHFPDYPSWRQILDYIRDFGRAFSLYDYVTLNTGVTHAEPLPGERWRVELTDGRRLDYDGLICCPGVTWHPNKVSLPGEDDFVGNVRHSVHFNDGNELRDKNVLIVGAGNSGVDIACDAARFAKQAYLSVRRGYRFFPKFLGGVPTDAVINGVMSPPDGLIVSEDLNQSIDTLVGDLTRFGLPKPDHDALSSHPIMNTQVLHCLGHGDLIAKPDIEYLTEDGVTFKDGTHTEIDEIILATGYEYQVPFVDTALFEWKQGHPQLYLNVFSRNLDSLYVIGFIEFADAAYRRFDEMAQLVIMDIRARETGVNREEIVELKTNDHPDLSGGIEFVDSPRHANYVESHAYRNYLGTIRARFNGPSVDDDSYQNLVKSAL